MYDRFTDRARKVFQLANTEAQRLNHEYIGTEHVLLGLIKEGSGVAANVLKNLHVELHRVREEVEKLIQRGPNMTTMGKLPQTPRTRKVVEQAIEEAKALNHMYVGTEHILLGLLYDPETVATQVLMNLGLKLDQVRDEVMCLLGHGRQDTQLYCIVSGTTFPSPQTDPGCIRVPSKPPREFSDMNHTLALEVIPDPPIPAAVRAHAIAHGLDPDQSIYPRSNHFGLAPQVWIGTVDELVASFRRGLERCTTYFAPGSDMEKVFGADVMAKQQERLRKLHQRKDGEATEIPLLSPGDARVTAYEVARAKFDVK